ncbi:MAG: hypothetical protein LBH10_01795 [Burkholderiaceae bacterium]|nr:hypothetical protein [Burkholderiaceae bacterium]
MILGIKLPALALAGILGGLVAVFSSGCGQNGPLYLPKDDPAAAQRATLPQALLNIVRAPKTPQPPASTASAAASAAALAASAAASAPSPAQPDKSPAAP